MSKKILLIEDRPERQKLNLLMRQTESSVLDKMWFLKNDDANLNLDLVNDNDFSFMAEYDLILAHKSALEALSNGSKSRSLISFCKDAEKDLIMFSGGITTSFYATERKFRYLLVNDSDFYSYHFITFLKNYSVGNVESLIEIQEGPTWRLSYLMRCRELLAIDIIEEPEAQNKELQKLELLLKLDKSLSTSEDKLKEINTEIEQLIYLK